MAQITRTQFRNALFDIATAQKVATPDLLRDVRRYRPGSMNGEKPVFWIGNITEALIYADQTRQRTMTATVTIATTYPTDDITDDDPIDNLLDALVERFTNAHHYITNTVLELLSLDDGDVPFDGPERTVLYRGAQLGIRLRIWEGRQ